MANVYGNYDEVIDRKGKKHRVYPALFGQMKLVVDLTSKFIVEFIPAYFYESEVPEHKESLDAIFELLIMAFDEKYAREDIEKFMDAKLAQQTIELFTGISGYKKKVAELIKMSGGEDSLPPL